MNTIYEMSGTGRLTGRTRSIKDDDGAPSGWTFNKPPSDDLTAWQSNGAGYELAIDAVPMSIETTVPKRVTMRQARLALMKIGKLAQVDAAIATLPADKRSVAEIEWEFSSEVFRERELVVLIGAALQLDDAALDALFIDAATL